MSNSKEKGSGIGPLVKSLVVTVIKLVAVTLAFTCKIVGLVITKIGELLEKLSGNGNH